MSRWTTPLVLAALLALPAAASAAEPLTALAWSTYLRSGPGATYAAIDELSHDVRVTVLGCDTRWCRVADGTVQGYIDRDALALPHPPPGDASVATRCVVVGQAHDRKPAPTRFCSARPVRSGP